MSSHGMITTMPGYDCCARPGSGWAFYNGGNRWTYGTYMYKAGEAIWDEDSVSRGTGTSWRATLIMPSTVAKTTTPGVTRHPTGQLIPSVEFERLREGLDDYRRLITLARLAAQKPGLPAARDGRELIATRMAAFKLGQRDHDALFPADDWSTFRRQCG